MTPSGSANAPGLPAAPADLLLAVLGVQLGYLSAEDALGCARELLLPGESRGLAELLVARGVLDRARAQVLERLAARAAATTGGDAAETLRLLPSAVRELAATTGETVAATARPDGLVEEQAHRYFHAPRADAPAEVLHRGRDTRVLLMHDTVLGRDVAWREAVAPSPESDARLRAQARLVARLEHPAVVPVYEVGRSASGAGVYTTLHRVPGRTLAAALTAARGQEERLALLPALLTVCRCVGAAHEQGVTHRHLTAHHVMLGRFGEVYVLGWEPGDAEGADAAARLADVMALGALLHEVLTGLPPPVMGQVRARGAPVDLLAVCRQALRGRLDSAHALANELKAWLDGRRVASYRYSTWELLRRFVGRHRAFSAMVAGGAALVVALALVGEGRVRAERDRSRQFALRFLDDVTLRLEARPGIERVLEQLTLAAVGTPQQEGALAASSWDERARVAAAVARLASLSVTLGRTEEARASLDFAEALGVALLAEQPGAPLPRLVLAQVGLARAGRRDVAAEVVRAELMRALGHADAARAALSEARQLAVEVRLALAAHVPGPEGERALDEALEVLAAPEAEARAEAVRRRLLARVRVERLEHRWGGLSPGARADEARVAVEETQAARARSQDDLELMVSAARAEFRWGLALAADSGEARGHLDEALRLARLAWLREPGRAGLAVLMVEAPLASGQAAEALALALSLEAQGQDAVAPLAPEAALWAGEVGRARALAARAPWNVEPRVVLTRALAAALAGKPGDALVQARALGGRMARVPWTAEHLARLPVPEGAPLAEAVRAFVAAWRGGDGEAALAGFVRELEAALTRR